MSSKFDMNDKKLLRIILKTERRHSKRNAPTVELKDDLNSYAIMIGVELTADREVIYQFLTARRLSFEQIISVTTTAWMMNCYSTKWFDAGHSDFVSSREGPNAFLKIPFTAHRVNQGS